MDRGSRSVGPLRVGPFTRPLPEQGKRNRKEGTMKTYGVFQHSSGPQGGFVVRTLHDGWVASPYNAADAVATYKRENAAQQYADKRNGR
jgi:hypothetical protein